MYRQGTNIPGPINNQGHGTVIYTNVQANREIHNQSKFIYVHM